MPKGEGKESRGGSPNKESRGGVLKESRGFRSGDKKVRQASPGRTLIGASLLSFKFAKFGAFGATERLPIEITKKARRP